MPNEIPFALEKPFSLTTTPGADGQTDCFWFICKNHHIYLKETDKSLQLPLSAIPPIGSELIEDQHTIGQYGEIPCLAIHLHPDSEPEDLVAIGLRESHVHLGQDLWTIAGRASQIIRWTIDHRYCGRCGQQMNQQDREMLRKCPACSYFAYPRLSPAVIMSITRENEILLGRAPRFPEGMYSTLAGFVEPGETLEEAVRREVMEEVGVKIDDISYVASQAWPFPHSLMIGFTARYAGGEIKVDHSELEDAGWFKADNMPRLPSQISVARRLIDLFIEECN